MGEFAGIQREPEKVMNQLTGKPLEHVSRPLKYKQPYKSLSIRVNESPNGYSGIYEIKNWPCFAK